MMPKKYQLSSKKLTKGDEFSLSTQKAHHIPNIFIDLSRATEIFRKRAL